MLMVQEENIGHLNKQKKFINAYKLDIPYNEYADFYYLINMFYSDYKRVFEKIRNK